MKNNNCGNIMVSYALIVVLQVLLVVFISKMAMDYMTVEFNNSPQLIELSSAPQEVIELISSIIN